MNGPNLEKAMLPPGAGASFVATLEGGFSRIEPLTLTAGAWLRANVDKEATWLGPALMVERRYFPDLADAIIAAGFTFERDAYPN